MKTKFTHVSYFLIKNMLYLFKMGRYNLSLINVPDGSARSGNGEVDVNGITFRTTDFSLSANRGYLSTDNVNLSSSRASSLREKIEVDLRRQASGVQTLDFPEDISSKSEIELDVSTGKYKLSFIEKGGLFGVGGGKKVSMDVEDIDFDSGKIYIKGDTNLKNFNRIGSDAYPMPVGGKALDSKQTKELTTPTKEELDADPETAKQSWLTRMRLWFDDPNVKSNADFLSSAAKIVLFTGLALWGVLTLKELFDRLNEIADTVNNETFKILELKRTSFRFSGSKICSGDYIYNFRGFENVQKESINNTPEFKTSGGETEIKNDYTFEQVSLTETITPPSDGELTFRVKTTFIRRILCFAIDLVSNVAEGVGNVVTGLGRGLFGDINWGIIILLFVCLIAGGVFLTILLR